MHQSLLDTVEQALAQQQDELTHDGWALRRIYGGMNGITYRAENVAEEQLFALKIRKRDERGRAGREFAALQALSALNEPPAPAPVALYIDLPQFPGDVVISSWIEGVVLDELHGGDHDLWERILTACARVHSIKPGDAANLRDAVQRIYSSADLVEELDRRYARLPDGQLGEMTKAEIGDWLALFKEHAAQKGCVADRLYLMICDTNPTNMIDSEGRIVIVDWESSGWGDPAFDIADLLVRPNCASLSESERRWVMERYAEMMDDNGIIERIAIYERLMLVFWLILTSTGFAADTNRFPGTRTFSLDFTLRQQRYYRERLEAIRETL